MKRIIFLSTVLGLLTILLFGSSAYAKDAIIDACNAEFGNSKGCDCASTRTAVFLGAERYKQYAAFFAIFAARVSDNATSADEILGPWDSSQGAYAKQIGADPFAVSRQIRDGEAVHRYALRACGLEPDEDAKARSLFFWGERL
ncbi:MAG: hypothetical protein AAGJ73_14645 [Pseudomonadota bacterium]